MHETTIPDLVLLHHDEPMTTSLAIAEGVQMEHASVIKLVRKYVEDLGSFGPIAFEMRKGAPLPHSGNGRVAFEMRPFEDGKCVEGLGLFCQIGFEIRLPPHSGFGRVAFETRSLETEGGVGFEIQPLEIAGCSQLDGVRYDH